MKKNFIPFLVVNPKSYLYGEKSLTLAKAADSVAEKMKRLVNAWYNVSLLLAVVSTLIAIFFVEDTVQKILWASIASL